MANGEEARRQRIAAAKDARLAKRENERLNRMLSERCKIDKLIETNPEKRAVLEQIFTAMFAKHGGWPPKPRRDEIRHVVCLRSGDYGDVVAGKVYEAIGDVDDRGTLRVIDDSGEDYLYSADWFSELAK